MNKKQYMEEYPKTVNGVEIIQFLHHDKQGHRWVKAKCPICGELFETREDLIKSGKTKSCGCLKKIHAIEMGKKNKKNKKKKNIFYYPQGCSYALCFYTNCKDYFIFDIDKLDIISKYTWTAQHNKNRTEPVTWIDGKKISLSRLLMKTPKDLECDHINQIVADARICNLRNCTTIDNLHNREIGQGEVKLKNGKYIIDKFSKYISSKIEFDTEEEAIETLYKLQDLFYGEFSFRKSQEIAKENETNQFNKGRFIYTGVLEKISQLPPNNVYNLRLNYIQRNLLNNTITDDNAYCMIFKLMEDYKNSKLI